MKQPAHYLLLLLFTLTTAVGFSQTGPSIKPRQFSSFPDIINCTEEQLGSIFNTAPGQAISLSFSGNFIFSGDVVNNVVKYSNLQTAVIRSAVFDNTIFSISKITNKDNSITYIGRIINKKYFDGYELKKNFSGSYQLVKMETDRVIEDCSQQ